MSGLLAQVVGASARATDATDLLDRVARLVAPGVAWVLADRLDDPDLVTRVAALGPDGPLVLPEGMGTPSARRSSARAVGLLPALLASPARALRLGEDELEALSRSPLTHLAMQAGAARRAGVRDLLALGLVARDRVLGVLTVGAAQVLTDAEVSELEDVARVVGTALDAARLLAAQRTTATAMQTSLLPPLPAVPGLRLAARYLPAAHDLEVGGDWYDAFTLGPGTDGDLVVVVGDVQGHDVQAAARMADLRNLLRAHAVDRDEPPAALLGRLERTADTLGIDALSTCVVARLRRDVDRGAGAWRATWASAGHPPPVLVHDGVGTLLEGPPDLMIGVQAAHGRRDRDLVLVPGDLLLLYTDGLVEVRDEGLDDRLAHLLRVVQREAGRHCEVLAEVLLSELAHAPTDDVALLALEVLPPGP